MALLAAMNAILRSWLRFATENTGLYLALCVGVGLVGRWYWCGQELTRFLNPFAPFFA